MTNGVMKVIFLLLFIFPCCPSFTFDPNAFKNICQNKNLLSFNVCTHCLIFLLSSFIFTSCFRHSMNIVFICSFFYLHFFFVSHTILCVLISNFTVYSYIFESLCKSFMLIPFCLYFFMCSFVNKYSLGFKVSYFIFKHFIVCLPCVFFCILTDCSSL